MHSLAIFMEEGEEKEAVVPKTWLTEKQLFCWPNKANSTKAYRDQEKPKKAWKSFEIVRIKMQSGSLLKRKNNIYCLVQFGYSFKPHILI